MARLPKLPLIPELAEILQSTEANALIRLNSLKLTPVCDRCCGSGNYSFNQVDGTICYGCSGSGHRWPKAKEMPQILELAKQAVERGDLDRYLRVLAARRAAKAGSKRIFAAWGATRVARIFAGWASHMVRDHELPGNGVAVREANSKMCAAQEVAHKAISAATYAKLAQPDYEELSIAAGKAVEDAIAAIEAADIEPDPELIAFVQEQQRASAERVRARGFNPGFKIYGEKEEA
jgi:hypothetical protein